MDTPFATRVREHRLRRLLSQRDLARRAGLQLATLQAIEHGDRRPRYVTLQKLAKALRVPMTSLVDTPAVEGDELAPAVTSAA
jgi:transcriptional regulator with XRE-family HTH domain